MIQPPDFSEISNALLCRVKAFKMVKGKSYTCEQRLDMPTKIMKFRGLCSETGRLLFEEEAVIDNGLFVFLKPIITSFDRRSDLVDYYELSEQDYRVKHRKP